MRTALCQHLSNWTGFPFIFRFNSKYWLLHLKPQRVWTQDIVYSTWSNVDTKEIRKEPWPHVLKSKVQWLPYTWGGLSGSGPDYGIPSAESFALLSPYTSSKGKQNRIQKILLCMSKAPCCFFRLPRSFLLLGLLFQLIVLLSPYWRLYWNWRCSFHSAYCRSIHYRPWEALGCLKATGSK